MPEDSRVLRRRRGLVPMVRPDGSIWNDDIVLVEGVGQGPLIQLAVGSYFQYLSACGALEDETLAAIRSKIPIRTPLRNRNLGSLSAAASGALRAQGVGANVVTVLMEENPKVLIQRRATTLAIYPGAWAVAPVFGCQPVSRGQGMEFDLLVDLFREYLEEFFDFEEAIHRNQRRLSDDWFLDEGPVVRLRQNLDRGTAEFELLGFGFDAFNGELDLSCLLTLPGDIAERDLRSVSANWEYGSIERVGLFSDALSGRIAAGDFQPGSAFALDLARQRLAPSSSPVAS